MGGLVWLEYCFSLNYTIFGESREGATASVATSADEIVGRFVDRYRMGAVFFSGCV